MREHDRDVTVRKYASGRLAMSEAAKLAGMTIWEFEELLVKGGFKSQFSLDDLQSELKLLSKA